MIGLGGLLATLGVTTWAVGASSSPGVVQIVPFAGPPPSGAPAAPRIARTAELARRSAVPPVTSLSYAGWSVEESSRTGVPARALRAYALAAEQVDVAMPGCHLNWATLAGIGSVESDNGGDGGGLTRDGRPAVAIYGPALDGAHGTATVADSDHGRVDADAGLDRAVGPLQFLPSTWRVWGTDADGDGVADAQDIDDAAPAAARYLCATGDLSTPAGWTDAVFSYNHSADYVQAVYTAAARIADSSDDS